MEGGVAIFLLLIVLVVAVIGGIALYVTGGAILAKSDREPRDAGEKRRPTHKRPTNPTQENVTFVGTDQDDGESRHA
jgi:hypothetical protein